MKVEVPSDFITEAEDYWDSEGTPLLRELYPNDQILIIAWSIGQEKPVLLSREANADEDYGSAATEAIRILPRKFQTVLPVTGKW